MKSGERSKWSNKEGGQRIERPRAPRQRKDTMTKEPSGVTDEVPTSREQSSFAICACLPDMRTPSDNSIWSGAPPERLSDGIDGELFAETLPNRLR